MTRHACPTDLRVALATLALLAAGAGPVWAHGGAFMPPPAPPPIAPPWMRGDPYNPRPTKPGGLQPRTPTPQLPHPNAPTSPNDPRRKPTPGGTGPGATPPPSAPPTTRPGAKTTPFPAGPPAPAGPAPGGTAGRTARERGRMAAGASDWTDWWDLNADSIRARDTIVRRALTGDDGDGMLALRRAREREILPLLRAVLAGEHGRDEEILASAVLALGKTADDPKDVERILELVRRDDTPRLARESAALALGLLRRSDPASRFDGALLDGVRASLFDAMDDDGIHVRARCFASLALGLLADQPYREGDAFARDGRLVVQGLWTRLREDRAGPEATVAILVGLSLQPPAGVPQAVEDGLRSLAATGRLDGHRRGSVAQAHAALALARLGGAECAGTFLGLVRGGAHDGHLRRSAVVALGLLAPRLDRVRRLAATEVLVDQARRGDPETAGLAWISTARLLAADGLDGSEAVARATGAHEAMLDAAGRGNAMIRPFAALAVGLVLRSVDAPAEADGDGRLPWKDRSLVALRAVADDDGTDPSVRAAYVLALGLARDQASMPLLGRLAARTDVHEAVRAHACASIGLLGRATPEALTALRAAMAQRTADDVRREAARALGTLGDSLAVPALVAELRTSSADHVRARAAVALGEVRSPASVAPLRAIVLDKSAGERT
ncbi:MAG TPA: HEAT repeat domain-containing protein, partial [Planctomycetota bacterium]|nr:HEAT repeat domain-containing protein [Planctomycetota bacterium]